MRKKARSRLKRLAASLVLLLALASTGLFFLYRSVRAPYQGFPGAERVVTIPAGSSASAVLAHLERNGVLRNAAVARLYLVLLRPKRTLKAGEYQFTGPSSLDGVLEKVLSGTVMTHRVTIPEGLTGAEIFELLAKLGLGRTERFVELFATPSAFNGLPAGASTLEGFLFPDTYELPRGFDERRVLSVLIRQILRRLPAGYEERARERGLTLLEAVTLASIVEEETRIGSERPLVAAVYLNRLRIGMPLQADPTTAYALRLLGRWTGTLTVADLAVASPYNTYKVAGLPPGPICNPGLAALEAALEPAQVPFLYFVARGDGSHRFAATYDEHLRNVALFRRARAEEQRERERSPSRAGVG